MKELANYIAVVAISVIGLTTFIGCDNTSNEGKTIKENTEMAQATYACPMDCENGKTYNEPGSCPVCGMDLTEVKEAE
jgi:hypothetical protein